MVHHEGLEKPVIPLRNGGSGKEKEESDGSQFSPLEPVNQGGGAGDSRGLASLATPSFASPRAGQASRLPHQDTLGGWCSTQALPQNWKRAMNWPLRWPPMPLELVMYPNPPVGTPELLNVAVAVGLVAEGVGRLTRLNTLKNSARMFKYIFSRSWNVRP